MNVNIVKKISLIVVVTCHLIGNVGFSETLVTETPIENELSGFERDIMDNPNLSAVDKARLLEYYQNSASNLTSGSTSDENLESVRNQLTEDQWKILKELDHQKELFGERAKRNDQAYSLIKGAIEMGEIKIAIPVPDANAPPEEMMAYYDALRQESDKKIEIAQKSLTDALASNKAGAEVSLEHLRNEDGTLELEGLTKEFEKAQEKSVKEQLTGKAKTACEVILCLSSNSRPTECTPPITEYLRSTLDPESWSDTLANRRDFLSFCPTTGEDDEVAKLAEAHANYGETCNLSLYNQPSREVVYNGINPTSRQRPLHKEDEITIQVVDSVLDKECKAYVEHEMMDLYLTPFRTNTTEVVTRFATPFNPNSDGSSETRKIIKTSYEAIWDLKRGEPYEFGTWYYEKPLEQ